MKTRLMNEEERKTLQLFSLKSIVYISLAVSFQSLNAFVYFKISFPPPFVAEDHGVGWLYEELQYQWLRWLPQESSPTIRKGAFYSVLVRPGFRIISLNMNYCNNKNWFVIYICQIYLTSLLDSSTENFYIKTII